MADVMSMQAPPQADPMASILSMAAPLAAKGQQLLDTGDPKVLAAGKAMQKKLGLDNPENAQAALSKLITGDTGQPSTPPDAFSLALRPGMPQPAAPPKNTGTKSQNTSVDTTDNKQVRSAYASPEQAGGLMDTIRNTPEAVSQREGIAKMENILAMNQSHQRPNDAWIKSLLAYGDSLNGTNQAASFEPQAAKQNESMLKFANDIQTQKGTYAKSIEDALAKLKTGSDTNALNQRITDLQMATSGNGGLGGGLNNRTKATQATLAGTQYDKEPMLRALEGSFNNFDKFQGIIDGKTPITSSVFNNLQEELTRATRGAQGGGAIADSAVVRDQMAPLAAAWNKIETNLTKAGKVPDMRKDAPALFTQLQSLKDQLRQDFENQYSQRVEQLRHNFDASSDLLGEPSIAKASHDKADQLLKARITHGKPLAQALAPGETAAAPPPPAKIKVSKADGSDARLIDAADLPHALADNYVEAK